MDHPDNITIDTGFEVDVEVENADKNANYYVKVLTGINEDSLTAGRTLSSDGNSWLAWNASWNEMPKLKTEYSPSLN